MDALDARREPFFSDSAVPPRGTAQLRGRRGRSRSRMPLAIAAMVALAVAVAVAVAVANWSRIVHWGEAAVPSAAPPAAHQPAAGAHPPSTVPSPELLPADPDRLVRAGDVESALAQLLGREAVLKFLSTTDFPRKAVATLDNLGRDRAPASVWPVHPAPGQFVTQASGASQVIAAENGMRYWLFVAFVDSIDAARAVDLYRRMFPVLQGAWVELGLGKASLHARVLQVIDLLLATPEPSQPPKVTITEVKGPIPAAKRWTRYEFEDPELERLSAGQKILLRVGPDNRKVLKARLAQFRSELLRASTTASRP